MWVIRLYGLYESVIYIYNRASPVPVVASPRSLPTGRGAPSRLDLRAATAPEDDNDEEEEEEEEEDVNHVDQRVMTTTTTTTTT